MDPHRRGSARGSLAASPLSIKFLLGNQLEEVLRSASSMNLTRMA
jgi:hypothetical protein